MPQLLLYLTDENYRALQIRTSRAVVSLSKYASRLIERDAENDRWPAGFWDLYGSIDGETFEALSDPPPNYDAEFERLFALGRYVPLEHMHLH